jgi:GTP-binding protein
LLTLLPAYPILRRQENRILKKPTVVIIGRPNVGKSTLFNRICGQPKALVGNESGMTRDRIFGNAEWCGREFELVDTGGLTLDQTEVMAGLILEQTQTAMDRACAILFMVDCRAGITSLDRELSQLLIQTGKPVFLVVNKCDSPRLWNDAQEFHELGFEQLHPISAAHGLSIGDLLEELVKTFPSSQSAGPVVLPEINVAIIGRPNVGKSTLLNRLLGEDRAIVSSVPGTTRDAVDSLLVRNGRTYRFIDTAGIRKKSQTHLLAEKLSVIMARKNLKRCDIALVVLDASTGVNSMDATIAGYAHEAGVSVILVVNKWDEIEKTTRTMKEYETEIRDRVKYLEFAPILFVSARTGQRISKLFQLVDEVAQARKTRVSTGELNAFLQKAALNKAAMPSNKQVRVHYITQVGVSPPLFVLFTNRRGKLHFSLERYLINQIRERYGFLGTPIRIKQRMEARGA